MWGPTVQNYPYNKTAAVIDTNYGSTIVNDIISIDVKVVKRKIKNC